MDARAARSMVAPHPQPQVQTPQPAPAIQRITPEELEVIQLHRLAKAARTQGSGIASNLPDPVAVQHSIAILMLRDLRELLLVNVRTDEHPLGGEDTCFGAPFTIGLIDRKLHILGYDGDTAQKTEPDGPGAG